MEQVVMATSHTHLLVFDPDVCRDSADEPHQFSIGAHPNPAVPHLLPAGWLESPAQEPLAVVKPDDIIMTSLSKW